MTETAVRSPMSRTAYAFDWIIVSYCVLMLLAMAHAKRLAKYGA